MWRGGGDGAPLGAPQTEALGRLLKEMAPAVVGEAVGRFLRGERGEPPRWHEPTASLLQLVVARKDATLDAPAVGALAQQADANADALGGSPKFASLLFTLVRSHGASLRAHLPAVRRAAERVEGFMRKTTLAALAKLEQA